MTLKSTLKVKLPSVVPICIISFIVDPVNLKYLKYSCSCHLRAGIIFLSSFDQIADLVSVILCVFCEVGTDFFFFFFKVLFI